MQAIRYSNPYKQQWNDLVLNSRNGTFLLLREYMDYHHDRMCDCSLLFSEKEKFLGCLPANLEGDTIYSHGGLTYGGLITKKECTYLKVQEMLDTALEYYQKAYHISKFIYKPIPFIYHTYPVEEDLYWLFHKNAHLSARSLSSTIDLHQPLNFSTLRKRQIKRATNNQVMISESNEEKDWEAYWNILSDVLSTHHHCKPVHTIEEIKLLKSRFPEEIKLFTATHGGKIIAGCVAYFTKEVIHTQYMAANDDGRDLGALDLLFQTITNNENFKNHYHYLDFGISTENGGDYLNEGLLFQKEGFGGRAVCYDQYEIDL
jgi:hypothetical protein